jgi:hypothetical protein
VGEILRELPSTVQGNELPTAENINQIRKEIDRYQKDIEGLREQLTPTMIQIIFGTK